MGIHYISQYFTLANTLLSLVIGLCFFMFFLFAGGSWTLSMGMNGGKNYEELLKTIKQLQAENKLTFANLHKKYKYIDNVAYYEILSLDEITVDNLRMIV